MTHTTLPESITVLERWEDFEEWATSMRELQCQLRAKSGLYVSDVIFRGQANARWELATTLERAYPTRLGVLDYYTCAHAAKHAIEAHTGRRWEIEAPSEFAEALAERKRYSPIGSSRSWEYMAYLRHHGFPSPFLDWSASPYVAAFFAFAGAQEADDVAIYAFLEHAGEGKGGWSTDPDITSLGHYFAANRRHHLQRSEYTHCTQTLDGKLTFVPHEQVLARKAVLGDQDLLWKVTLPGSERGKALRHLDQYNLNAYSLFGSEEALMQTVAFREFSEEAVRREG